MIRLVYKRMCFIIITIVIIYSQMQRVIGAPIDSSNNESISAEELKERIINSQLEDKCEIDQHRKDQCELCVRFLYDRSVGYLGCCTNYDGIYNFCEDFLNYSYEDQPKHKSSAAKRFPSK